MNMPAFTHKTRFDSNTATNVAAWQIVNDKQAGAFCLEIEWIKALKPPPSQ